MDAARGNVRVLRQEGYLLGYLRRSNREERGWHLLRQRIAIVIFDCATEIATNLLIQSCCIFQAVQDRAPEVGVFRFQINKSIKVADAVVFQHPDSCNTVYTDLSTRVCIKSAAASASSASRPARTSVRTPSNLLWILCMMV